MLKTLFCVGLGSFLGGVARYGISRAVASVHALTFTLGTLVVNAAGCLLIGMLYGWFDRTGDVSPGWRLFLTVGFCGGFTTFSTFAHEDFLLLQSGRFWAFAAYALLSFALGLLAVWLGHLLVQLR